MGGGWEAYELADLLAQARGSTRPYLEFLHRPTLSCGIYRLPQGSRDGQGPHEQDEVYHVLAGKARFQVEGEDRAVQAGSVLFVEAGREHRFHGIEEDLEVLVFFSAARPAPAEAAEGDG